MEGNQKFELQLKNSSELINITNNSIIQVELTNTDSKSQFGNINSKIKDLKQQINELKVHFEQEYHRLSKTNSIFFDEQFKSLLEMAFFDKISQIPEAETEKTLSSESLTEDSPITIPNVNDTNNNSDVN